MKKLIILSIAAFAVAAVTLAFTSVSNEPAEVATQAQDKASPFPDEIAAIFENSCNGCHDADASNLKAKTKLNFGDWSEFSDAKKVGKIEGIAEEVSKGGMPPAKYVEKNPGAALSAEQKEAIATWAKEETDRLLGAGK